MKRKLEKRCRAAVSIFLVIVILSTTLLSGLFIDAGRILLAKRAIRNAANSAARSALSYYDKNLADEYGLFAVDKDTAEEAFKSYLISNITLSQNTGFDIMGLSINSEDISVTASASIMEHDVMLESMEEFAKYRSIVDTSLGVIEKLKGLFGGNSASKAYGFADAGSTALEQLESQVEQFSTQARAYVSSAVKTTTDHFSAIIPSQIKNGATTVSETDKGYDEIQSNIDSAKSCVDNIDDSKEAYDETSKNLAASTSALSIGSVTYTDDNGDEVTVNASTSSGGTTADEMGVSKEIDEAVQKEKDDVNSVINETQTKFDKTKSQINSKTNEALKLNAELSELETEQRSLEATISALETSQSVLENTRDNDPYCYIFDELNGDISGLEDKLLELQKELSDLAAQGASIYAKEKEIQIIESRIEYETCLQEWENAKNSNASNSIITEKKSLLDNAIKDLKNTAGSSIKTTYDDELKAIKAQITSSKATLSTIKSKISTKKEKRDKLADEIEALYKSIPAEKSKSGKVSVSNSLKEDDKATATSDAAAFFTSIFKEINKYYTEFGKLASNTSGSFYSEQSMKNAFGFDSWLDNLFGSNGTFAQIGNTISSITTLVTNPESVADAFLFTNYVFETHSFLTSQTSRSNRHFQVGEIEYILEGNSGTYDSQMMCIGKVLRNIALLRLVINFVDYFITSADTEIFSRLLISLGRAAIQTIVDMVSMIFTTSGSESATCALSPSLDKVRLTYSDHLRLSMLIAAISESGRNSMMDRLQTLMKDTYEVKSWGDPSKLQTYISADITVEVDLIMLTLPMFESLLPEDNEILQNGKFLVHEKVYLGY